MTVENRSGVGLDLLRPYERDHDGQGADERCPERDRGSDE
jgi:hypothetical protein